MGAEPPSAGLLGGLMGLGDNPTYQRLYQSGLFRDLGAGLASGTDLASGIAAGTRLYAQNAPGRETQARDERARLNTAARLRDMGPEYAALADAVEQGVMDAGEATRIVWNAQRQTSQQAQETERARANAQFLQDPLK